MSQKLNTAIAVIGIDIGRAHSMSWARISAAQSWLRQKWSRGQVEARLANIPPCRIGMEDYTGHV